MMRMDRCGLYLRKRLIGQKSIDVARSDMRRWLAGTRVKESQKFPDHVMPGVKTRTQEPTQAHQTVEVLSIVTFVHTVCL